MSKPTRANLYGVASGVLLAGLCGFLLGRVLGASVEEPRAAAASALTVPAASAAPVRVKMPVSKAQPSRGPADALVTVVQFCDLRGAVCRAADGVMTALSQAHPSELRWVHRHRLDAGRREESMRLHQLARAAFQQAGKFWELRALALALPDDAVLAEADYERLAREVGLDYAAAKIAIADRHYDAALQLDDHFTRKFGVADGVGYFVNGRPLERPASDDAAARLKQLVNEELTVARGLVARGVAKADVYRELIKDGAFGRAADGALSARAPGGR